MSEVLGKRVEHKFNGRPKVVYESKRIQYPVDGYVPEDCHVLQFHGCHWHGHGCKMDGKEKTNYPGDRVTARYGLDCYRTVGMRMRKSKEKQRKTDVLYPGEFSGPHKKKQNNRERNN